MYTLADYIKEAYKRDVRIIGYSSGAFGINIKNNNTKKRNKRKKK